jgi:hypothetical protein
MKKLAKRKLGNLAYIKSLLGIQNDPDRHSRLKNKLELADSLASIANATAQETALQKAAVQAETRLLAPAANNKLVEKGLDPMKLTKK